MIVCWDAWTVFLNLSIIQWTVPSYIENQLSFCLSYLSEFLLNLETLFGELKSEAKTQFCEMDEDKDGFITVEDMKQSDLEDLEDLDEKEIEQMFLLLDDDGDGKISFTGTFSW